MLEFLEFSSFDLNSTARQNGERGIVQILSEKSRTLLFLKIAEIQIPLETFEKKFFRD